MIRADHPHLAASPDGVWSCSCCGSGTLEIKCPFKYKDSLDGIDNDSQFCLSIDDGLLEVSYPYYTYYQVQFQMFVAHKVGT